MRVEIQINSSPQKEGLKTTPNNVTIDELSFLPSNKLCMKDHKKVNVNDSFKESILDISFHEIHRPC